MATKTTLIEMILLFTGDTHSHGSASVCLAEQICLALQPNNLSELRTEVFGAIENDQISEYELMILERGYNEYVKRKGRK